MPQLHPGQQVHIQDPKTFLWSSFGIVLSIWPDKLSYNVLIADQTFIRPRRFLRPASHEHLSPSPSASASATDHITSPALRRSARLNSRAGASSIHSSICSSPLSSSWHPSDLSATGKTLLTKSEISNSSKNISPSTVTQAVRPSHPPLSSEETNIDQSNYSISFINLHWASFLTGLSSALAVVVLLFLIAGCYFRGKRQRQSRARHAEVLWHIVSSTGRHTSTPPRVQSGPYPGPPSNEVICANPFLFESPVRGAVSMPAIQFSASAASCGLPGGATKYDNVPRLPAPTTPTTTPGPSSSSMKAAPQGSIPSPVKVSRPVLSVKDYNLASIDVRHSHSGSVSRLLVHFECLLKFSLIFISSIISYSFFI